MKVRDGRILSITLVWMLLGLDLSRATIQAGSWNFTGSLTTAREFHTATLLPNGKVLVAGGRNTSSGTPLDTAELYDPSTGLWTTTSSLAAARVWHTATLLPNGKVLVVGGRFVTGAVLKEAELFDPATGTWTYGGTLNEARESHTATLLPNGKLLVAGGDDASVSLSSTELFDPATGTWTASGFLNDARANHTANLLPSGKVLVAGGVGFNQVRLASAELYDPASGVWSTTGSMGTARSLHTATLLSSQKVLVAGGLGASLNDLSSAELYDFVGGNWSTTSSLSDARSWYTATSLPNGNVLVAGGYAWCVGCGYRSSTEQYDPASGTWASSGLLNTKRSAHTATLLQNGKVLVAAGGNGYGVASAELYGIPMPAFDPIDPDATPLTLTLRWEGSGYVLEEATSIPNWTTSAASISCIGNNFHATDSSVGGMKFYRLRDNSQGFAIYGNPVGYIGLQVPGGWSMRSNPFQRVGTATKFNDLFRLSNQKIGTTILKYSMASGFTSSIFYGAAGWIPNLDLVLGEGIGIGTASGLPLTLHMAGPLAVGPQSVQLPAGIAVVAPPWPAAKDVTALNYPVSEWAWVFTFDGTAYVPFTYVSIFGFGVWWKWIWNSTTQQWDPLPFFTPSLSSCEAFWSWRSDTVNWMTPPPATIP